ncbi:TetR/AcrR family transcriptional regulator [Reyranella sp. CPCC 100927]|uniref:TetR/AcrR family transcriptional regulator n=1 Tax=Reyranella sp. CPCC 100927 TaxID=2599616 RepID=UPI0011B697DF|nr:TetR/AcrR family transcriptional regulator [Reyranella sp. CPCC 100927]TWT14897.1 TetR/AcrR family transcriptional regulator [Reyranella sp. CPCC 100927]
MEPDRERSRREEYSEATRLALLQAAKTLFASQGYQATGIEAVAQAARVTRGALYHHFDDKKALFDAVVVDLQAKAAHTIATRARAEPDKWRRLRVGTDAFLEVCLDPAYRWLVIQEAPAILGRRRYQEIDEAYPLGLMTATLISLRRDGELTFDDPDLLSRMISAMICEVAQLLADSETPETLRPRVQEALDRMLAAFRRSSSP